MSNIAQKEPGSFISAAEVAGMLNVSIATVNRWVRHGDLIAAAKAPGLRGAHLFDRARIDSIAQATRVRARRSDLDALLPDESARAAS